MKKTIPVILLTLFTASCNGWVIQPEQFNPPTPFLPPPHKYSLCRHHARVQKVHGIDDHCTVGSVFPHRIAELLNGLEGMKVQRFLPGVHATGRPISINTPDSDLSMATCLDQHLGQQ